MVTSNWLLIPGAALATLAIHGAIAASLLGQHHQASVLVPAGQGVVSVFSVSLQRSGGKTGGNPVASATSSPVPQSDSPRTESRPVTEKSSLQNEKTQNKQQPATEIQSIPEELLVPDNVLAGASDPQPVVTERGNLDASDGGGETGFATGEDIPAEFTRALMRRLAQHKDYPVKARLAQMEGTARVYFAVKADGHLQSYRLVESTGHALLDQAVHDLFRDAFPLPKRMAHLAPDHGASFHLPVNFALK